MNKKGQVGVVSYWAASIVFIIWWALAGATMVGTYADNAIQTQGLTGLEAFLLDYIGLVVLVAWIIATAAVTAVGFAGGYE